MTSNEPTRPQIIVLSHDSRRQVALSELLGEEYAIFATGTPEGALTILARQKERIRLVLTDLKTLRKGGLDVVVKALQTFRALRVIVFTPSATTELRESGCMTYVSESLSYSALQDAVAAASENTERSACTFQDLLELFSLSQAKVALTLVKQSGSTEERGKIYFEQGKMTNAFGGGLAGEEAIHLLSTWKEAAFFTRYNLVARQKPLSADWRDLFAAPTPQPDVPQRAEPVEMFRTILRALSEQSDGLECVCVLDDSDRLLAVFPEQEPAHLASLAASMARLKHLSEHAGQLVGIEVIDEISVIHDMQLYMLYPLPPIGMLGVLTDPEHQGMLRWNCHEAILRIQEGQ